MIKYIRDEASQAISRSFQILRARIDKFGVTQPNIQKLEGSGRILVELPGVDNPQRVRKLLQGTAKLEFWRTYDNPEAYKYLTVANDVLSKIFANEKSKDDSVTTDTATTQSALAGLGNATKTAKKDTTSIADTTKAKIDKIKKENPLFVLLRPYANEQNQLVEKGATCGIAAIKDTAKINTYLNRPEVKAAMPSDIRFAWNYKGFGNNSEAVLLFALKASKDGNASLSGDKVIDAKKDISQTGQTEVSMNMNAEGAHVWRNLTKDNVGHSIAIVLDDVVYSAPNVQNEIPNGRSSITGSFTAEEASDLANILKAGKLPAPTKIVGEAIVGPTLGQEAITSGLFSFVIALLIVLAFMAFYYNSAGLVADIALFANVFFVVGVLSSLGAVLTLPGIAGIVLTIGMSVDANILIFERVREELAMGKATGLAIKEGYRNAMSSVIDSHVTGLLLGIILYVFGTGPIQGFATTLIIGIISSLFCAIFITRLIFDRWLSKNKTISFDNKYTAGAFKKININFVAKRKWYYIFSSAIIICGIVAYITKGGFTLGVDFKGGRSYVVRFDNVETPEAVRDALTKSFGEAPEVKTYGENTQLRITTTYLIGDGSEDAEQKVESKLEEGLTTLKTNHKVVSSQKVGETVSRDIKSKAVWAVLLSCLVMFMFIFIRFKKWQYGLGAVVALFHDVLMVLSIFVIFDGILPFSLEITQDFIAAILTVMSYSMTDTVVVFDRIREYLTEKNKTDLHKNERVEIINYALNSTLSRTINTSLTIFFVLAAIFIFGGETIRGFSFALLIGIVIGTYSSICIATPIVIDFEKEKEDAKSGGEIN